MFHLSLPIDAFEECLGFYNSFFDADVVEIAPGIANVFMFGAQVTFHDRADTALTPAAREAMHFGAVVSIEEWARIRDRLVDQGSPPARCVEAADASGGRAKLVVADPSGNLIEINSGGTSG